MADYQVHCLSMIVKPEGEPIFSEMASIVGIDDEASGPFVTVTQHQTETQRIAITAEEWPMLRNTIDQMIEVCARIGGE